MTDTARMTKAELIEEILRLRQQYEECSTANGTSGKFDDEALFALADEAEGDELFLVTETGRFVHANETALDMLGYSESELLALAMPNIDPGNSRAAWLGRVSRLKQNGERDVYETTHLAKDGSLQPKQITAAFVTYRARNYVLCIGKRIDSDEQPRSSAVKSREQVLMQTVSDGVLVVDTRGGIIDSNVTAERMLGLPKSEIIGRACTDSRWRLVDGDGSPLSISNHPLMISLVEEQPLSNRRINMLATDGTRRMMMINTAPLFDESGMLTGAIGCIRPYEDSVERKEQQRRDSKQTAMFREAVMAVLGAGSEDDLERQICELLVRSGDYALAWRGVKKATDERIHPTVSAGEATDYLMKIKVRYDDSEYGNGPYGRAVKTRTPVVVADLASDASYLPWRMQTERTGLHSLVCFPLEHEGMELGLLTVYSRDRNSFVGTEFDRLREIASLLSFGLGVRRRTEDARALRTATETQQTLLDAFHGLLPVAVARFDRREPFRCEEANQVFLQLIDEPYRSTGVVGTFITDFMYAAYQRDLYQQMMRAAGGESVGGDDVFTDWQGDEMHWSWRIVPVLGDAGSEELLYAAYRRDRSESGATANDATERPAHRPAEAVSQAATSSDTSGGRGEDGPAVLRLEVPRFGPRTKPETRIARFYDEARVLHVNAAARARFSWATISGDPDPTILFPEDTAEFLSALLSLKESGITLPLTMRGKTLDCQVFIVPTDEAQQYILLCD